MSKLVRNSAPRTCTARPMASALLSNPRAHIPCPPRSLHCPLHDADMQENGVKEEWTLAAAGVEQAAASGCACKSACKPRMQNDQHQLCVCAQPCEEEEAGVGVAAVHAAMPHAQSHHSCAVCLSHGGDARPPPCELQAGVRRARAWAQQCRRRCGSAGRGLRVPLQPHAEDGSHCHRCRWAGRHRGAGW